MEAIFYRHSVSDGMIQHSAHSHSHLGAGLGMRGEGRHSDVCSRSSSVERKALDDELDPLPWPPGRRTTSPRRPVIAGPRLPAQAPLAQGVRRDRHPVRIARIAR